MNRYLMLTAAALLAGTASAGADCYTFTFASTGGASFCDGGMIGWSSGGSAQRSWRHINNNCAGASSEGFGLLGKTKGFGDFSTMSDDVDARNNVFSQQVAYSLPKNIKNGQPFVSWVEVGGTTAFETGNGILVNVAACTDRASVSHGRTSTLAGVTAIMAARRAPGN
jgi:hypothetical protein